MSSLTHEFATPSSQLDPLDGELPRHSGNARYVARILRRDLPAIAGLFVIIALVIAAAIGPFIAASPTKIEMERMVNGIAQLAPFSPSWQNPFGTDQLGRDILSRVLYGLRTSLIIGVVVRGLTIVAGAALGLLAAYSSGIVDTLIMRIVDILYAFPVILLAMAITVVLGPGFNTLVLALVLVSWPDVARLVRGQALTVKQVEYVDAARALGAGQLGILRRHMLPNCLDTIIVAFSIGIPGAIMYEAGLSFFGFGIQPPTPSLGSIIADGRGYITSAWWYPLFPGLTLMLVTVAFNLLGDGLTRALDPRRRS